MPPSRLECITFALLSSALSSVATLFKVQGVQLVPPLLAAPIGVLIAALLSWPYLILNRRVPRLASIRAVARPLWALILLRPIIANMLFTIGLSMTSGIKAVFLTKMEPYLVIFWVWLLDGRRPRGNHLLLLAVHVVGAILLSCGGTFSVSESQWGDLIVFLAVIAAALSYRFVPAITKELSPLQTATIAETVGGLLTLPIGLWGATLVFGPAEQIGWMYIAVHSVMFYIFAVSLLYASLGGIEGWLSSALRSAGPVIAAPIAWLFFGERLSAIQLVGGAIVLITSALISRSEKRGIASPAEELRNE